MAFNSVCPAAELPDDDDAGTRSALPHATPPPTRPEVYASHAMACTAHPLATQAALNIMRSGGSAIDAAIAANACLGLMEPTGCGVGGDLFAIIWDPATHKLHAYNGSGRSPSNVSLDDLRDILRENNLERIPPGFVLVCEGSTKRYQTMHIVLDSPQHFSKGG